MIENTSGPSPIVLVLIRPACLYIEVLVVYAMVPIELLLERCMTAKKNVSNAEMLKGTLEMMILRTLLTGDAHGHTIAKVIERTSEDVLEVEKGSLYPALHRLQDRGGGV